MIESIRQKLQNPPADGVLFSMPADSDFVREAIDAINGLGFVDFKPHTPEVGDLGRIEVEAASSGGVTVQKRTVYLPEDGGKASQVVFKLLPIPQPSQTPQKTEYR